MEKIEIIQCLFSDHSGIKLEIRSREIPRKLKTMWQLNSILQTIHGMKKTYQDKF